MNILDATETAYKNGYAQGVKEFAERVRELTKKTAFADCWSEGGFLDSIDNLVKEMTEESQ
jgi:hypothetical protein